MFANVAASMAGGTAALAEMTQAPGQWCKVHSVAMFRAFRWSRIPEHMSYYKWTIYNF